MDPAARLAVVNEFLAYLEKRELSICNYSKNGAGFWPIGEPDRLAARFVDQ